MKTSEIKELTTSDLLERIDTERTMLIRMRLNHAITPLDNPQKLKQAKIGYPYPKCVVPLTSIMAASMEMLYSPL